MTKQEQILIDRVRDATASIFERELLDAEKQYILSRYPYVVISNFDTEETHPTILFERNRMQNGWPILDYGDHLISGCNELMAYLINQEGITDDYDGEDDEDDDGGKTGRGRYGTIVQQYTDVAFELVRMAILKGWSGIRVGDGYYSMSRMVWVACEIAQFHCSFKPTAEDFVVRNWAMHIQASTFYPHENFPKPGKY